MANNAHSTRKSKGDGSNSSRKTPDIRKGSSTSGSAKRDSPCLRRSTRETPSRKHIASSSSTTETPPGKQSSPSSSTTRKSERLEKKHPTPPVKRKLKIVEEEQTTSPLRRSDRGNRRSSLRSSDSKDSGKVTDSPEANRKKLKREKSVKQLSLEAIEISKPAKQDTTSNGMKKKMDGRTFKSLFMPQRRREIVPDTNKEPERLEKLSRDDRTCCRGTVSKPEESGEDGGAECRKSIGEECVGRDCEGGKVRSDSRSKNANAEASSSSELKISCLSTKSSREDFCKLSQEDGLDAFDGSKRAKDGDDETLQVDHAKAAVLPSPDVGRLLSNVEEGTNDRMMFTRKNGALSPSSACEEEKFVLDCATCFRRRRVDYNSPPQELCFCSIPLNKDLRDTSISEDRVELARCEDSLFDVPNGGPQSTCSICKLGGELLCCDGKGCKKTCHLSCLDPPLDYPPKVWYCFFCVKKKIEYGVHSVSEGVESIWDAREIEIKDNEGLQKQRQFFIKYKGLAHIHNHWVPETQLLLEAPMLVSKFNQQKQDSNWREEWIMLHRLLKKRLLWSPKQHDNCHSDTSNCQYEWLVKWCGLDYEHATWELENASFLHSPQVQSLIRKFESRHQWAKEGDTSSSEEKRKNELLVKLPKLPAGFPFGDDHNQLNAVNKLRENWHKGQNAVVINDQERFAKVILFLLSLVSDVSQPFLIISSSSALSVWEAEFSRLAPSIDVVVYNGNQDNRKIIRTIEFDEDGGRVMFQVLLSSIEAVVEDLKVMCPKWQAIIVDECQDTGISKHFKQISMLRTAVRILLFNDQLKDNTAEHLNLLSLLEAPKNLDSLSGFKRYDSRETCISKNDLREKLSRFIAYECKLNSSRFLEYWVPVLISDVQLEQYCSTLLSNSAALRSSSKNDLVGALPDILISTRKCCDHPYIVDPDLPGILSKGLPVVEYLDVGIKASGKLQLLDTVLSEIKNRGLRVLILFQSIGGYSGISIGDILDDLLRQRFGADSYERVDRGIIYSKKQAAVNIFNDKASGRFVLLLEKRACHSSIRLSSVDTVMILDSDWNPTNDFRALHKISIDSSPKPIKTFRLYTSCTLEEKVLDLATQHMTLDSNLWNISRSISHMLLMWGASYLFGKLDEFHGSNASNSVASISSDISILKDIAGEFLDLLIQDAENSCKNSLITKVRHTGVTYSKNEPLFGQLKFQLTDAKEPHLFWTKLLEGRNPRWRFSSVHSQRNRKRVQYFEGLPEKPDGEISDVGKKRKKVVNNSTDAASPRPRQREGGSAVGSPKSTSCTTNVPCKDHTFPLPCSSNRISSVPEVPMAVFEEGVKLRDVQKYLRDLLKPELVKLYEILQLPEDVKTIGGRFLEYILENHHINREPATILQAFQISLIWIAASLLKYKLDKKQSLALAKQHLNFGCTEEEASNVYSKLRLLKKLFLQSSENLKVLESSKDFSDDRLKRVLRKCEKRKKKLIRKHEEEIQEFYRVWEEKRAQLENEHRVESAVVRAIHANIPVRLDKLKRIDDVFAKNMEAHKHQKDIRLQELKAKQLAERNEENHKADSWLKNMTSAAQTESATERQFTVSERGGSSEKELRDDLDNSGSVSASLGEKCSLNRTHNTEVAPFSVPTNAGSENVGCGVTTEIPTIASQSLCETDTVDSMASHREPVAEFEQLGNLCHSADASENSTTENFPSCAQETHESTPDELAGGANCETLNPDVDSSKEHNERNDISVPDHVENCNAAVGSSSNDGKLCSEPPLVTSPLVQLVEASAQAVVSPHNLAPQDESSGSFASAEMLDGDAPGCENINIPQQVEVSPLHTTSPEVIDQTNHDHSQPNLCEASTLMHDGDTQTNGSLNATEQVEAPPLPSFDPELIEELPHEELPPPQNREAPPHLGLTEPSNQQSVLHSSENLVPSLPTHVLDGLLTEPSNQQSVMQSSENLVPSLPTHVLDGLLNQSGTQMGMHPPMDIPLVGVGTHMQPRHARQMDLQTHPQPSFLDPLQNEMERLRKESEEATKLHEDTKLRLKSEFEKELEEIHRKYETKLKDAELAYLSKKKALDAYHNKVFMNRILAEAFRTKCLEFRPPVSSGMQQVPSPNFLQQLLLLSSQPPRPFPVSGSPNVVPPAASQRTAGPSVSVQRSSTPLSSMPMRPPRILPVTRPTGNFPVSGEIRAPAPHLQPFRPSLSTSAPNSPSVQRGLPSQESQRRVPLPSVTQVPSWPTPPPSVQPLYQSGHHDLAPQPENTGGLPSFQNSALPALGLLANVENSPGAHPPKVLPHLPDSGSNFVGLYLPQGRTQSGERVSGGVNLAHSSVLTEVVCLSDDE